MSPDEKGASLSPPLPDIPTRLRTGLDAGLRTAWKLVKYVIPLYFVVELLKQTELLPLLGRLFAPAMALFGLPGEVAFAFIAGGLLNLYAALAVIAPLQLEPWQVTQCGLMMGIAHNLLLEGGVLRSTGTRAGVLTVARILLAVIAGLLYRALHHWGGF